MLCKSTLRTLNAILLYFYLIQYNHVLGNTAVKDILFKNYTNQLAINRIQTLAIMIFRVCNVFVMSVGFSVNSISHGFENTRMMTLAIIFH